MDAVAAFDRSCCGNTVVPLADGAELLPQEVKVLSISVESVLTDSGKIRLKAGTACGLQA